MTDCLVNVCAEGTMRGFNFFHFIQNAVGGRTELNLLNFMGHVAGANFAQISCWASEKVPALTRGCVAATCPWNTSRQLFHKSGTSAIWSLPHVPATQPCNMSRQCVLNAILFLQHFAATCSRNMSRVGAPLHIRVDGHKQKASSVYKHCHEQHGEVIT